MYQFEINLTRLTIVNLNNIFDQIAFESIEAEKEHIKDIFAEVEMI